MNSTGKLTSSSIGVNLQLHTCKLPGSNRLWPSLMTSTRYKIHDHHQIWCMVWQMRPAASPTGYLAGSSKQCSKQCSTSPSRVVVAVNSSTWPQGRHGHRAHVLQPTCRTARPRVATVIPDSQRPKRAGQMHSSDAAAADDAAVRQTLESTLCTLPVHAVQSRPTGTMHPRVKPARRGLCVSACTLHACKCVRTASSCVPHLRSIALSPL